MNIDVDILINEDIDIKNEMHSIFKQLEDSYEDIRKIYEKFEKPFTKIVGSLKDYAKSTVENQQDSPFFSLAKKYESLVDGQQQLVNNLANNVITVFAEIMQKSILLNDTIKELNNYAKDARNLKKKIIKMEEDITKLHAKGKVEKIPKKETEKKAKESEFDLAKDRLIGSKGRFDTVLVDFNQERDGLLKGALKKLAEAENAYIEVLKEVTTMEEETVEKI